VRQDTCGSQQAAAGPDADAPVPLILPDVARVAEFALPANTDPKSPETYIASPVGATVDTSAVLGDRVPLSGVDKQRSMLAGALHTGTSRKS
jgi:hypothetical protein